MKNLASLLQQAKAGTISKADVQSVATELGRNPQDPDAYTLLHIVGRSFSTAHRDLVEGFLTADWDPMLAKLALQIVCSFWNETSRYLDYVRAALRPLTWDDAGDVRLIAISITGTYLASHKDRSLLRELIRIFSDEHEGRDFRQAAYHALGKAYGRSWKELPPASRDFDLEKDIDARILEEAKRDAE